MKLAISVPIGAWHPFLPSALESLKAQGDSVRVALLDASGDARVEALADSYDDMIAYRRHGQDGGQSDAILEGWNALDGDWLGWLNADDMLTPDAISHVKRQLNEDPSIDVIYGHSAILDESSAMTGYHFNVEPPGPKLLSAGIISQPSCFFRRESYQKVGGLNPDLHYVMDWDLWIRLYQSGAKFEFIDECLSFVLWAKGTKTASLNRARRAELNNLIAQHAPEANQKPVFRDFIIHAVSDRLYPLSLRRKVQRRLRSVSGAPFGIRGDGLIMQEAAILFAHYGNCQMSAAEIRLDGEEAELGFDCSLGIRKVTKTKKFVRLEFEKPLQVGQICKIVLNNPRQSAVYFQSAHWREEP